MGARFLKRDQAVMQGTYPFEQLSSLQDGHMVRGVLYALALAKCPLLLSFPAASVMAHHDSQERDLGCHRH
jgi:hypothetical protein